MGINCRLLSLPVKKFKGSQPCTLIEERETIVLSGCTLSRIKWGDRSLAEAHVVQGT